MVSRMLEILYRKNNPAAPWLTSTANLVLSSLLKPEDVGVEFGAGRSTIWLAGRIKSLTSVEHDKYWFERVVLQLKKANLENVSSFLTEKSLAPGDLPGYLSVFDNLSRNSLDVILVDGLFRDRCALSAVEYLKSGGVLIIDNANLYLPSNSASPNSLAVSSPPATDVWNVFLSATASWRRIWTSNGVYDTAIYLKP